MQIQKKTCKNPVSQQKIVPSSFDRTLVPNKFVVMAQLSGRLFSPSDICKKLSHHFLLHFPIGMGSYDHHTFFIRVPPLEEKKMNSKGGLL